MPPIRVSIKHSGKTYNELELDTSKPGGAFKQTIYEKTGVPVDRMKVMIKGGTLKDDTDWAKVGVKEGQVFTVIGAAGELPKPPPTPVVFLEDMDEKQLANALNVPVGLQNLGNTCYMNATVQALRSIPELQATLQSYAPSAENPAQLSGDVNGALTTALGALYQSMSKTMEPFPPFFFLQLLRQANPQFAEVSRSGGGFAQQDADECWSQILTSLSNGGLGREQGGWTNKYMAAEMETKLTCDEAPDEAPTLTREKILKLQCNISMSTNYMHTGIMESLDQKIVKNSPSLGREATYTQHSRVSRLPENLTIHMVRFYWRRDINKKAKIMRKVKFPFTFDVVADGIVAEELKNKLAPVNNRMREIERERAERQKVRKKVKQVKQEALASAHTKTVGTADVQMTDSSTPSESMTTAETAKPEDVPVTAVVPGDLPDEKEAREKEKAELEALVDPTLKEDLGANVTGIYELCAIVTHKGASADGGHYIAWVRKDEVQPVTGPDMYDSASDEWYKFDDEKVSIVKQEKISQLDGGGEDSTAYILLYRSKSLD